MDTQLIEYDDTADILYIWYTHPAEVDSTITEEREDFLLRKNRETGEIIGVTIMHLSKRDQPVPIPQQGQQAAVTEH